MLEGQATPKRIRFRYPVNLANETLRQPFLHPQEPDRLVRGVAVVAPYTGEAAASSFSFSF
jgi:hypothetical protein